MVHQENEKTAAGSKEIYQPPHVVKINDLRSGAGDCRAGSGDSCWCMVTGNGAAQRCESGNGVMQECNVGNSAFGWCGTNGNSAECNCD